MTIWTDGARVQPAGTTIEDVGKTSLGEYLGTTVEESFHEWPLNRLKDIHELDILTHERPDMGEQMARVLAGDTHGYVRSDDDIGRPKPNQPLIPVTAARQRIKDSGLEGMLKVPNGDGTFNSAALDVMITRGKARREREDRLARGPDGTVPFIGSLATSFFVGAADPLNLASAFIPVVGEARYAQLMAGAGTSTLARFGVRAGVGAAEGAVGQAALEPIHAFATLQEGRDYTMVHALQSIGFGAVLGSGLRSGGGLIADVWRGAKGRPLFGTPEDSRLQAIAGLRQAAGREHADANAFADLVSEITEQAAARDQTDGPTAREQAHLAVFDDAMSQLKAAGMADEEAAHNAAIVAARYATRAERLGAAENAFDLYRNEGLSIRRGEGEPGGASEGRSFDQSQPTAPTFFSAVQRTVETGKLTKGSPDQWLATIKNTPGVKPEELEWLGLADWLKQQKGAVTKEQVAEYVRANQIEVKDVTKGEWQTEKSRAAQDINQRMMEKYGDLSEAFRRWTPEEQAEYDSIHGEASAEFGGLGGANADSAPKFSQYQLPGGENYRELLLTLPSKKPDALPSDWSVRFEPDGGYYVFNANNEIVAGGVTRAEATSNALFQIGERGMRTEGRTAIEFRGSHWDEPNVLAHMRFNDRTINGKRTLMIEEIQSDWHQQGRSRGYNKPTPDPGLTEAERIDIARRTARMSFTEAVEAGRITAEEATRYRQWLESQTDKTGVPDAPFKTTWPELSLKRMIRYASENGYDQIAWTPGHVQAERYDLSKHISELRYTKNKDGTYAVTGDDIARGGAHVLGTHIKPEELPDHVGKEIADKIIEGEGKDGSSDVQSDLTGGRTGRYKSLSGLDLKVGGEGMSGFYDKILPAAANKLVKKYGARVGEAELKSEPNTPRGYLDAAEATGLEVERRGDHYDVVEGETGILVERFEDGQEANEYIRSEANKLQAAGGVTVHTLPITPALRDAAVSQGFPLFQGGAEGGPRGRIDLAHNKAVITLFAKADKSTFMHEAGHLWLDELVRDANAKSVPQALKDDLGTVLRWLGVDKAEDIGTEQHEKWARGFEAYLAEGNAPSTALAKAFESFKQWLTQIYRSLRDLNAPLNDEIRGVMDRLLASDMELAERLNDLPPQAHEDLMRASIARVIEGQPVNAGEILDASARMDPRIAQSWPVPADAPAPEQAWRDVARPPAPEAREPPPPEPASVQVSDAAPKTTLADIVASQEPPTANPSPQTGGESTRAKIEIAPQSPAAKAAVEADARAAALYEMVAEEAGLTAEDRAGLEKTLAMISADRDAQVNVMRRGVACLAAGLGVS